MRTSYLLMIMFLMGTSFITARADTISYRTYGFRAHYGFIIPHSSAIEAVSHTNPYGFEFSINKLHTSYNRWQVFNAYWFSGIQAAYFNYQYPGVLGSVFDVTVYAEPVLAHGKNYFFTVLGGAGFSYHTEFYDREENPLNQFFSTPFNFPLFIDLRLKYRIAGKTYFTVSGCYNHISNGGFKQPNKGMNFPTLALGFERFNRGVPVLDHNYTSGSEALSPGLIPSFLLFSALKILEETEEFTEEPALVIGFNARFAKQLRSWYQLNFGAEFSSDGYIKKLVEREGTDTDHRRAALTAGQDFLLGNVVFAQHLGFYIYSPYKARNSIYQKYELGYRITSALTAGVYLKAHLHVAEMMGFTLSYSILRKAPQSSG
ncbi:MAG: acyloxyacyl hydrolase [Bacteroidales bacterium]|nr:acyloxyacyl hydrolase [Bacteroidales bacterium]